MSPFPHLTGVPKKRKRPKNEFPISPITQQVFMDVRTKKIAEELKRRIIEKYKLQDIRIFGSSVRGEQREDSDIDIFVHLNHSNRHIEEDLFDVSYDLELEYDCLIDLIIVDDKDIKGKIGSPPIYENILSEGASL